MSYPYNTIKIAQIPIKSLKTLLFPTPDRMQEKMPDRPSKIAKVYARKIVR